MSRDQPPPPAHVAPYVAALGTDEAVRFLLTFGGAEVYFPKDPKGNSAMARAFGVEAIRKLVDTLEPAAMKGRIPLPKKWIAQVLVSQGLSVAKTARKLHMSDTAVRNWTGGLRNPKQPDLFDDTHPHN